MRTATIPLACSLALLAACDPAGVKLGEDSGATDTHDPADDSGDPTGDSGGDSGDPTDYSGGDSDGDGYPEAPGGDDCDDADAEIHPGAAEAWDGADNDCDGVADGDGAYSGELSVRAQAVFEGRAYNFTMGCPTTLTRAGSAVSFLAICTTDPNDPMAAMLLGAQTWLSGEPTVGADQWSGGAVLAAHDAEGRESWDTYASSSLAWDGFGAVSLSGTVDAFSLSWAGEGRLERAGP